MTEVICDVFVILMGDVKEVTGSEAHHQGETLFV